MLSKLNHRLFFLLKTSRIIRRQLSANIDTIHKNKQKQNPKFVKKQLKPNQQASTCHSRRFSMDYYILNQTQFLLAKTDSQDDDNRELHTSTSS